MIRVTHTTKQLSIYQYTPMKHIKISCLKHRIDDNLLLSSRCMTNYMKSCSFLHVLHSHFFELMKVVENLFKKLKVKNSFMEMTML